jgi:hypothetical protein
MKPVRREIVSLAELRPGDTCIIKLGRDASLVAKVVDTKAAENLLLYVPALFSTFGVPEFVPADDRACSLVFAPSKRFERIFGNFPKYHWTRFRRPVRQMPLCSTVEQRLSTLISGLTI